MQSPCHQLRAHPSPSGGWDSWGCPTGRTCRARWAWVEAAFWGLGSAHLPPLLSCYGLNCAHPPPHSYVEVLTSRTSECDLVWRWGLYGGPEAKMRSLGWALIQYDWCPYKKEKFGNETHTQGRRREETQREDSYLPGKERGLAHDLPSQPSGEPTLPTP